MGFRYFTYSFQNPASINMDQGAGYTAVASYNRVLNYSLVWGMGQEDPGQTRTHGAYYDYLLSFDCEVNAALLGVLEGSAPRQVNCSTAHVNKESWACSE